MPYIAPYRSQLRPYNHAYAYRGLTAFATLSMAVSDSSVVLHTIARRQATQQRELWLGAAPDGRHVLV
ncbi:MAG: hypothetical protein ABW170_00615 [Candidatus Thiodiazotropha sp. L084R]